MTDEELIARLRELASFESEVGVMQDFYCGDEIVAAADRIEALAEEVAKLRQRVTTLPDSVFCAFAKAVSAAEGRAELEKHND